MIGIMTERDQKTMKNMTENYQEHDRKQLKEHDRNC